MVTITDAEFVQLTQFIKSNYGIHLRAEKKALVVGRLHQVLMQGGFGSFTDYLAHLNSEPSGSAIMTLIDRITTNHTFFMREADHFDYFRDNVLPWLVTTARDRDLRIWSAACSSGEEPYTLAMILDEFFGPEKTLWDARVLATDISEHALSIARKGVYSNERVAPLPMHWRSKYFAPHGATSSVLVDRIRSQVIYRKFNLMSPLPFRRRFHVIFCRNVMIYFDNPTKAELVNRLYDHLEQGGYLFIGHSESLNRETTRFTYITPAVYRKL